MLCSQTSHTFLYTVKLTNSGSQIKRNRRYKKVTKDNILNTKLDLKKLYYLCDTMRIWQKTLCSYVECNYGNHDTMISGWFGRGWGSTLGYAVLVMLQLNTIHSDYVYVLHRIIMSHKGRVFDTFDITMFSTIPVKFNNFKL